MLLYKIISGEGSREISIDKAHTGAGNKFPGNVCRNNNT